MQNPRLAARYAKSLTGLAVEMNLLEAVHEDMLLLQKTCRTNPDFVSLLRSPVVNADKKEKIFLAIFGGKVNTLTEKFITLLIEKGRESFLPEMTGSVISQYQQIRKIKKVRITSAVPLEPEMENAINAKVNKAIPGYHVELETAVKQELIGGFMLEMDDTLFDATIQRDLKDIRKQFLENIYVPHFK